MKALHSLLPLAFLLLTLTALRFRDGRAKVREIYLIQKEEKATAETKQLRLWHVGVLLSRSWSLASFASRLNSVC